MSITAVFESTANKILIPKLPYKKIFIHFGMIQITKYVHLQKSIHSKHLPPSFFSTFYLLFPLPENDMI